ncbi:MAG: hypothetical protein GY851_25225 [bacterium]|nr:hypothetical protein [bacterium]
MNTRNLAVLVAVVIVVAAGIGIWRMQPDASGPPDVGPNPPVDAPVAPTPAPPAAPVVEPEPADPPEPAPEPVAEAPAETPSGMPDFTTETLTGTAWKMELGPNAVVSVEFAADGQWLVDGRPRAKWEIVGNRVRMYDDKGEEHFVNIKGHTLLFNEIEIPRAK